MSTAGPPILILARRLIALEAARDPSDLLIGETARVSEKLRVPLSKFLGAAGFRSIMGRAFMLASREFPCLDAVKVRADGSLEGFDEAMNQQDGVGDEAGTEIVAQLLGLLTAFVGEHFMMRLVRDTCPEAIL
ncbi:hypothetical protein [Zavarzinella formosa]|uniref:hypothetical protein n=1 Tax=Zavarzinella formosa TaxID=360055 RepID=UPI0002FA4554|nr:hypothetical protein [Zavarzinella formosa]